MRNRQLVGVLVTIALMLLSAGQAYAASDTWKVYLFNPSGRALASQQADVAADGTASFTFPRSADAAYLTTSKVLVGDRTGGVLSASVSVTAASGTTYMNYPGCTQSTANPTVGLYFQTKASGGFNPSDYWWSSDRHLVASLSSGPTALSTALQGANWTNFYGQPGSQPGSYVVNGTTYPSAADGFAAAVANVTSWGVSFGGDCFYANGVGTPTGSAVFSLTPPTP